MNICYALEPLTYTSFSIFLAGPTPRDSNAKSWRPSAVRELESIFGKTDNVCLFYPEDRTGTFHGNYDHQTEWEYLAISSCNLLLFWVPRSLSEGMPGFTTNVEFGLWLRDKDIVFGYPESAEKMTYLTWLYAKEKRKIPCSSLSEAGQEALWYYTKHCKEKGMGL